MTQCGRAERTSIDPVLDVSERNGDLHEVRLSVLNISQRGNVMNDICFAYMRVYKANFNIVYDIEPRTNI